MSTVSNIFGPMNTSVSALRAQRQRIDIVSSNLANAETTRTPQGGPYQRQQVVFEAVMNDVANEVVGRPAGVRVSSITTDARPPIKVHMPGHPDADAQGNVMMPDVRVAEEMADLMSASRSYEANAAAFKISRQMFQRSLELGKA
jgi:flagellar basal-body rod protein FlgC